MTVMITNCYDLITVKIYIPLSFSEVICIYNIVIADIITKI